MNTNMEYRGNGKSADEIERDIDYTRALMHYTVRAIEQKLSPGQLIDQVIHQVGSMPTDFASNLSQSVRQNPLAVCLTVAGLSWLMRPAPARHVSAAAEGPGIGDKVSSAAGRVASSASSTATRLGDAASRVGDYISDTGERTSHLAHDMGARTREASQWARRTYDRTVREEPLILGAIGIAIGALLGSTLPISDAENEYLGPVRDDVVDKAKRAGAEQAERAKEALTGGEEETSDMAARRDREFDPNREFDSQWQGSDEPEY